METSDPSDIPLPIFSKPFLPRPPDVLGDCCFRRRKKNQAAIPNIIIAAMTDKAMAALAPGLSPARGGPGFKSEPDGESVVEGMAPVAEESRPIVVGDPPCCLLSGRILKFGLLSPQSPVMGRRSNQQGSGDLKLRRTSTELSPAGALISYSYGGNINS